MYNAQRFSDELVVDDHRLVHLVVTIEARPSVKEVQDADKVSELKEFIRMFDPSNSNISNALIRL